MTITLELKPEVEARLQTKAATQGKDLNTYLQAMLESLSITSKNESPPFWATATPEEWRQVFVTWIEGHKYLPSLPPEAFTRESFYGDRG